MVHACFTSIAPVAPPFGTGWPVMISTPVVRQQSARSRPPATSWRFVIGHHSRAGRRWGRRGQMKAVDFVGHAEGYALFGGEETVAPRVYEAFPPVGVLFARPLREDMAYQVLVMPGQDSVIAEYLLVRA